MPLADAFVSNDDAVKLITKNIQPLRDLGGIDVKSIDIVKLGQLYALMTDKTFAEVLPKFPAAHAVSDDGPWIFSFPAELQSMLAGLTEAALSSTADRWAQIPEFGFDRVDGPCVASMLKDLANLARLAQNSGDRVYLWNGL